MPDPKGYSQQCSNTRTAYLVKAGMDQGVTSGRFFPWIPTLGFDTTNTKGQ
jgi:hypothetical protein